MAIHYGKTMPIFSRIDILNYSVTLLNINKPEGKNKVILKFIVLLLTAKVSRKYKVIPQGK
jgi:hypothetical protein